MQLRSKSILLLIKADLPIKKKTWQSTLIHKWKFTKVYRWDRTNVIKRALFLSFCFPRLSNSHLYPTLNQMTQDSLLGQAQAPLAERHARICSSRGSEVWVYAKTHFNKSIFHLPHGDHSHVYLLLVKDTQFKYILTPNQTCRVKWACRRWFTATCFSGVHEDCF